MLVPVVVAALAFVLTRNQSRSGELLRTRLDYYRLIAPDLNRLMCYMTFIGNWRDKSPANIIDLKRRLDENFHCAAPLFSPGVLAAYDRLMDLSFATFGNWEEDARIKSSAFRRRQAWLVNSTDDWAPTWSSYFTLDDSAVISADTLSQYRRCYDELIAATVRDLDLTRARAQYTTDLNYLNAHAPRSRDITGSDA